MILDKIICGFTGLDRVKEADISGIASVIVLNELAHKLVIAEVAENENLKPHQVITYIKSNPPVLTHLKAYEIIEDVESNYNSTIVGVDQGLFTVARKLMKEHSLLSNDALHLAAMKREGITDIATNDSDFDGIEGIQVWKPKIITGANQQ